MYRKLTVPAPAGIVTGDAGVNVPVAEVVFKLTVMGTPASTRLPKASSKATVIVPDATPAVKVCGTVLNTSRLASAALTVSCCVDEASPAAAAVSVGVPTIVSV